MCYSRCQTVKKLRKTGDKTTAGGNNIICHSRRNSCVNVVSECCQHGVSVLSGRFHLPLALVHLLIRTVKYTLQIAVKLFIVQRVPHCGGNPIPRIGGSVR